MIVAVAIRGNGRLGKGISMAAIFSVMPLFAFGIGTLLLAIEVDPMTFAAASVMILGGIGAMVVQIINAWYAAQERAEAKFSRKEILTKTDDAASAAKEVARKQEIVVQRAAVLDTKVDAIKSSTEKAADNTNGHLTKLQDELSKALQSNKDLHATITTLTDVMNQKRAAVRATDRPAAEALASHPSGEPPTVVAPVTVVAPQDDESTP
jgi:hypothetical protein